MPQQTKIHRAVLATAVGVSMLGGTFVFAEHRDNATTGDTIMTGDTTYTETERARTRQSSLDGGFYDDRDKTNDWFYDYYGGSGFRGGDRTRTSSPGLVRTNDMQTADAARTSESFRHDRGDRMEAYNDYYSDRWFYEGREPAYVMPTTTAGRPIARPVRTGDEDVVNGKIDSFKHVRNRDAGGQNIVALIRTADNKKVIADLGPAPALLDLALTEGDRIMVGGHRQDVGPYSVLMAHHVKTGVHHVYLDRGEVSDTQYRQVDGRIDQFRDVRVRRDGDMHRVASVGMGNGRYALVDLGPSTAENVPANIAPGDRMVASGHVIRVGNYPVLVADQASFKDGQPVRIARPDGELGGPSTSRPFEASQQERMTDHTCIGGGCEGTVFRPGTRDKHSNAMDGVIHPEPR